MPKVRFLVAAALLSTSVCAQAANLFPTSPLIQIGDDTDIFFDSAVALEVTDNLYSAATKTASTSWTVTPGLTLEYGKDSPLSLTLSAKRGYVYFNKASLASLEDSRDNLSGNLRYAPGGPLTITLDSSYRVTARNDELAAQGVNSVLLGATLVRQSNYSHTLDVGYQLTERTKVNVGFINTYNHYLNPTKLRFPYSNTSDAAYATRKLDPLWDTINYNTNSLTELNTKSIPVAIDYQAPGEKITYGFKYQHDVTDYSAAPYYSLAPTDTVSGPTPYVLGTRPAFPKQLVKDFYGLTAKGQATESGKLNITAKVGYAVSKTDAQPSSGDPSYSVTLSHTLTELITHTLTFSRDTAASSAGGVTASKTYTYGANFNAATDLTLNLSVTKSDVLSGTTGVNTMVYTLGADYKYNSHLSLQAGYSLTDSKIPAAPSANFTANAFTASAAFRY
jgi:hypothetical protein